MRILVVDDSKVARAVIRKVLGEIGYTYVQEASDGVEAFTKLHEQRFDLVMTDWTMPRMDGLALVRKVREAPELDVPVLMVSGETYVTRFVEVIRAGAAGYIRKPFTDEELESKINEVLKKRAMRAATREPDSLRGNLDEVGFPELVQFLSSCSLSGRLVLDHEHQRGTLDVRGGDVVAGYCGEQAGDDAVYAMAEWEDGRFRFEPDDDEVVTNTTMPTLPLLVEAMKRRDERARAS
ncbi:MAG: response regulator [Planctomycetota bacterium]